MGELIYSLFIMFWVVGVGVIFKILLNKEEKSYQDEVDQEWIFI